MQRVDVRDTDCIGVAGQGGFCILAVALQVFRWYVQHCGPPRVNLFVDHSQVLQLEALRRGLWGTEGTWGRVVVTYGP